MKLSKRFAALFVAALMAITVFTSAIPVMAANTESNENEIITTNVSSTANKTVKDNEGNKYGIVCSSTRSGKTATVTTRFSVSYYNGGTAADKKRVDAYSKSLTAKGAVTFLNLGSGKLGGSTTKTGASNSYAPTQEYLYNVLSVSGTHAFSCKGATYNATTYYGL